MNQTECDSLTDRLISHLRKKPGQYFAWDKLLSKLNTKRVELVAALMQADEWEYKLRTNRNKGVKFVAAPDLLTSTEILHGLKTRRLGRAAHAFRSVKSTNDLATRLAEDGAPEGVIVTAEEQTKGRGRLGRNWFSPPKTGIYLSIILRPTFPPEDAPGLSVMTAVALADTLVKWKPGLVQIKWPNDIWINSRKTAGILTELSAERNGIHHVIVGVGINVNHQAGDFPEDLRATATSLRRELRRKVDRLALLRLFLANFEKEYTAYLKYRLKKSLPRVRKYSALLAREVTLQSGQLRRTGVVKDIDRNGALILQTATGLETITAGEVTVVRG
ncbi:MAG: biotin--[acetyl-CoA-carboxylase] ligase [candidate division Zixibacteria bacterium]|nr:biotin--[acetyl-CoA-carboxylase] ligase [candidate division Zixibacteria bacterium]